MRISTTYVGDDVQCPSDQHLRHAHRHPTLPVGSDASPPAASPAVTLESAPPPAGVPQQYARSQYSRSQKSTSGGQGPGGPGVGTGKEKWSADVGEHQAGPGALCGGAGYLCCSRLWCAQETRCCHTGHTTGSLSWIIMA